MILKLLVAFLLGIAGHQLRTPTARWFPTDGLNRLASYAEGGVLVLAAFTLLAWEDLDGQGRKQAVTALIMALFGVGGGTVAGWLYDLERSR